MNLDISPDILTDANKLRNSSLQKKQIRENVIEILRRLNEDVKTAQMEGKHMLITGLPIIFDISNMHLNDARIAVWSTVIMALKEKNYRVWVQYSEDFCELQITWVSEEDEQVFKMQTHILKSHTKKF